MKKAIIIGAGPAGLTAAWKLLQTGEYTPVILEESNDVGGISKTVVYNGNRMDIGGHRFFSKSEEVNDMWLDLLPLQGKKSFDDDILGIDKPIADSDVDPNTTDKVMLLRNRISRIYFLNKFFDYPLSLKPETFKNMGFARTVRAGCGYVKASICKKKEDSLENFYINRFGRPLYEMFFEDYTTKLWGRHPSEISAEWGAQRVKGLSLMKAVANVITKPFKPRDKVETSLIEQYYYPKLGPGQLWETLAERVVEAGGTIVRNARVTDIVYCNEAIRAVKTENGDIYEGDEFFSTMPVKDLICGMNGVPEHIRSLASGLPYRDFITVGLLVDKLKLENKTNVQTLTGNVPDCWIYVQDKGVKVGRIQLFNNWSPYLVNNPHQMWIGLEYFCTEGDEMWNMSDSDFIQFAISEMEQISVLDKADVKDSTRIKVKKAYPAYFDTYTEFDQIRTFLDGIPNLWCIGRNGQHRYNNMDHSMLTAIEAVKTLTSGSRDKTAVWNVNTEQEYHESK